MNSIHTRYRKDAVLQSISTGQFSIEQEIQVLVNKGYDEAAARNIIQQALKEHRYTIFQQKLSQQKNEEKKKLSYFILLMITVAGPVFDISNMLWYVLACIVAGAAGYYGQHDKPFAGLIGGVLLVMLFPLTYVFYMSGRHSYLNIELLIPLLISAVPAWLLQFFVGKLFYNKDEISLNS